MKPNTKTKLIRLPKMTEDELKNIKGGNAPCTCNCSCSSTANSGCISGSGDLGAG